MSRSYKKPWVKDPANRYMKRMYAQAYRSHVHKIEKSLKISPYYGFFKDWQTDQIDTLVNKLPHRRDVFNQYDICDFKFHEPEWIRYRYGEGQFEYNKYHLKATRK